MPSLTHEAIVQLFRDRPALAPELLAGALGVALPVCTEVRTESADLTQVAPTEYRADLVVLLVDGQRSGGPHAISSAPRISERFCT